MLAALNHLEGSTLSFCVLGFSRILHDLLSSSCHISWPPKLWDVGGTHICHSLSPSIPPCSTLSLQLTNRSVTRVTQALPLKPFARKSSRGIGFEMPVQVVLGFFFFLARCYRSWEYRECRVWPQEALDSELRSSPCFKSLMQPLNSAVTEVQWGLCRVWGRPKTVQSAKQSSDNSWEFDKTSHLNHMSNDSWTESWLYFMM